MPKFYKTLLKIAIPVTLQSMLQASFSIIDQVMIGQLGEASISSVGLCGNFTLIFTVIIGAVSTVAGILMAQFIGSDDKREAWCSFWVSALTSIIISSFSRLMLSSYASCRIFRILAFRLSITQFCTSSFFSNASMTSSSLVPLLTR